MDELLRDFLTETHESLDVVDTQLLQFEQEPNNATILGNIFRLVHTIKGTCGFIGLPRLEALTHAAEGMIGKFRDGEPVTTEAVSLILTTIDRIKDILDDLEARQTEPAGNDDDLIVPLHNGVAAAPAAVVAAAADAGAVSPDADKASVAGQSIRVHVGTLEHLMTMVSELVLTRNQLLDIARRQDGAAFQGPLQRLSNVTAELQTSVMKTRMQPIGKAWQHMPRLVRDLCGELGKQIDIDMRGEDTELDRQVLELIKGPLTHMVRNCADHGVEPAAERIAAGKPPQGTIRLSACQEGGFIHVTIADDGRGLDLARIRTKAIARKLADERQLSAMSIDQIHALIFAPGFSTADRVTSVSGRGVGMDVVRSHVEQIGGSVAITSAAGAGMSITLRIPLTLAIVPALIVQSGGERYAIPQLAVSELVRAGASSGHRIERINDATMLRLRDRLLPLIDLKSAFAAPQPAPDLPSERSVIVVMQAGGQMFGVVVEAVLHTEEIVVKPLSARLRPIGVFSGNTILGDGAAILIVDPGGLAKLLGATISESVERRAQVADTTAKETVTPVLLFEAGGSQPRAIALESITRLEDIAAETIERINGRPIVQYRGRLMPLIGIGGATVRASGLQPVLVVANDDRIAGLLVDRIVDIVEQRLDLETFCGQADNRRTGSIGSAVIKGRATELVDAGFYLANAFADAAGSRAARDARAVLVVETSPLFRTMLSGVLKGGGYRVSLASCAAEATALLGGDDSFGAVVAATDATGMDVAALASAVRACGQADTPIVLLSPMVRLADAERDRQVGAAAHIAKFDRAGLLATLQRCAAPREVAA